MTLDTIVGNLFALAGAGGLGGVVTYVLTLRQRRRILDAKASDVESTGQARIMDAAGRILEHQGELVPGLLDRIGKLEGREEARQAEVNAVRVRAEEADQRLGAVLAELDLVYRFAGEAARWMENALRLVQELGAEIPPPPRPPERTATPAAA